MSVGSVFVDIIPRIVGLSSSLTRDVVAPSDQAGTTAGKTFADSFAKSVSTGTSSVTASIERSVRAAQTAVESASTRIVEARNKELDAADRVRVAETKLAEARAKYAGDSSQIIAAEARVEAAKRNQELASTRVADAESVEAKAKADLIARNAELAASEAKAADAADASQKSMLSRLSGGLGVGAAVGSVAGIAAAFSVGEAIKSAADYQQSLVKLETTAGELHSNIAMVGQGMLDMAGQTGESAQKLAQAMYTVESAGFHGADALTIEKAAAEGARQENADLGKVVDATTTILHDYHLGADQAANVTSQLITAVSHGKVNFDELTGALHSVTPVASSFGVSLADVAGSLAAMTASGESADQASQNLAATISYIGKGSTGPARAELAQFGIDAQQLANNLGKTGISGALQEISTAIMQHMGPAGTVMLSTFNQSKLAAQDATTMFNALPPAAQKVAKAVMDGSLSFAEYRKTGGGLAVEMKKLTDQWLTTYTQANSFNNLLKSGGPDVQSYTGALARATGTQDGLRTALMLTGENAIATNAAIKDIASSSAQADGNIKGWSEVQSTFNQQAAETVAQVKAWAIEAGQNLLPALTGLLQWVNGTGIPGIKTFGSDVGDVAHWFSQLPGPVKEAASALAIFKAADMLGWVDKFKSGIGSIGGTLTSFGSQLRTAQGAMGLLKSAGSGLLEMFGGPWGIAIAGATLGIGMLQSAIAQHDAQVKKATDDVLAWNKAIAMGDGGQTAIQAQEHLDGLRQKLADVTAQIDRYNAAAAQGGARGGIGTLVQQQKDLREELDKGKKSWQDQLASMTPVEEAQARYDQALHDLQMLQKNSPGDTQALTNAEIRLHDAQQSLNGETSRANDLQKTQIQRLQDQANAALGLVDANRQALEASLNLTSQVTDYNKQVADGSLKGTALQQATLGLVDSAEQAAKAAGDAAAQQAKQNGATDTGSASQSAFMKSLQDSASTMTGPARQAVEDYIKQLGGQQSQAQLTAGAINALGVQVTDLPNQHMITIDVPTDDQMKKLHDLGYVTTTLPNGKVVVTADTTPAIGEIQDLLNYARQQSITYRSSLPDLVPNVSGGGRMGHAATGGEISGPGTGTSDSIPYWLSDGEFVVNAKATAQHRELLHAINSGQMRGYASGGWVGVPAGGWDAGTANIPVSIDEAGAKSVMGQMMAAMVASGGPGGAAQWSSLVLQALAMENQPASLLGSVLRRMNQESGGNANAINLWDSNAAAGDPSRGLMQVIGSTFAAYHYPGTSWNIFDPLANVTASMNYALARYGSLSAAYDRVGGYDNGGWLKNGQIGINTSGQPEPVFSAAQWKILEANLSGASGGAGKTVNGMVVHGDVVITDTEQQARESFQRAAQASARFGVR